MIIPVKFRLRSPPRAPRPSSLPVPQRAEKNSRYRSATSSRTSARWRGRCARRTGAATGPSIGSSIGLCAVLLRGPLRGPRSRAARASSLRSGAVPIRSRCAPRISLISTPGGVFSHTPRTPGAVCFMRTIARPCPSLL